MKSQTLAEAAPTALPLRLRQGAGGRRTTSCVRYSVVRSERIPHGAVDNSIGADFPPRWREESHK